MSNAATEIQIRVHGSPALPTLVYLPGLHGDWTLVSSFRHALDGQVRFVEMTYPRTRTWSLEDYAKGIETALLAADVREGWLIGESFGSQPAWSLIGRRPETGRRRREESPIEPEKLETPHVVSYREERFRPLGLILAGGFVKHPWPWGAKFLRCLNRNIPRVMMRVLLRGYATYARFRHRQAPDTLANVAEFVMNRLHPDDPAAMEQRYTIVAESDVRPVAQACTLPVFHLAGLVDPIVPGPLVRRWLRQHCPGFRGGKTIVCADHNVLGTAPENSATKVLEWLKSSQTNPDAKVSAAN